MMQTLTPRDTYNRPRMVPCKDWSDILVIQSGLSVSVHGHFIDLNRDVDRLIATVRVKRTDERSLSDSDKRDVREAANLLAKRAKRFLSDGWTVVAWQPPVER